MIVSFLLLENNKLVSLVQHNILLIVHVIKAYFFFVFFRSWYWMRQIDV